VCLQIVAIFTGTTAKLTNFIISDDLRSDLKTDSRAHRLNHEKRFYQIRGRRSYEPFYTTTTVGCLRFAKSDSSGQQSEYITAVPRGRPLFAGLTEAELKLGEPSIVQRIVQDSPSDLDENESAWLSVLGTRVQMGQTTFDAASRLVGHSYANLVGATPTIKDEKQDEKQDNEQKIEQEHKKYAKICFPPDPVCARLAMCLMDEEWSISLPDKVLLKGRTKTWWVEKMKLLFSKNLCAPEKGDFGEVMVALYFLFCADVLRRELSVEYTTFSVPLDQWIACLRGQGPNDGDTMKIGCQVHFSAIQVCRNYVRAYNDSWSSLQDEGFLENMYRTGVGFYVFAGCSVIDLVFALRVGGDDASASASRYIPMFVSVKSHTSFGPKSARLECEKMEGKMERKKKGADDGKLGGALCLLVVFGSSTKSNDNDFSLEPSCAESLKKGETVSKVLRIPTDDVFGLSEGFLDLTTGQDEMSEVLASHSFLGAHREADISSTPENFVEQALRLRPKNKVTGERRSDAVTKTVGNLLEELGMIVGGEQSDQKRKRKRK
jgi:hypothetical protein